MADTKTALIEVLMNAQQWIAASRPDCDEIDAARWDALQRVINFLAAPTPAAQSAGQEVVGVAGTMPGTDGFTMACFEAAKVPVGTPLYAAPVNGGEQSSAINAELLEALDKLTDVYAAMRVELVKQYPQDGWSVETMTLDAARAALSKARGEA